MSDINKNEVEHHAVEPTVKRSKKRRCLAHCGKFWWAYLIAFIAIVVLVVCLIIFVAVPKIAQHKLDEADLEIQGVNILQTESNSYTMEVNSTITTKGGIKADVDGFRGEIYLEGAEPYVPFAALDFPKTNADKHQVVNVSQRLEITDMDAFTKFNVWFVNNETLQITIKGDTKVKPSGLSRKYDVTFKKTLDVPALNLFKGTEVTGGEILKQRQNNRNFVGNATIPNRSYYTLDIGNVSFKNFANDEELGYLFIDNLLLVPGDNKVNLTADLAQGPILKLVQSPEYCQEGVIPFHLQGNNVTNNGEDLSYFADGLASGNQTVPIDIARIIKDSLGFPVVCSDDN